MTAHSVPAGRVLALRADVVATVLHDGAVLLDLESKFFYSLNSSGWAIAQLFEDGSTAALAREHGERLGAARKDLPAIDSLIESMVGHGLLAESDTKPALPAAAATVAWVAPTIVKHAQPLQKVMVTAFDPGIPFTE